MQTKKKLQSKYQQKLLQYQQQWLQEKETITKTMCCAGAISHAGIVGSVSVSGSHQSSASGRTLVAQVAGLYPEMLSPEVTKYLVAQIARKSLTVEKNNSHEEDGHNDGGRWYDDAKVSVTSATVSW